MNCPQLSHRSALSVFLPAAGQSSPKWLCWHWNLWFSYGGQWYLNIHPLCSQTAATVLVCSMSQWTAYTAWLCVYIIRVRVYVSSCVCVSDSGTWSPVSIVCQKHQHTLSLQYVYDVMHSVHQLLVCSESHVWVLIMHQEQQTEPDTVLDLHTDCSLRQLCVSQKIESQK